MVSGLLLDPIAPPAAVLCLALLAAAVVAAGLAPVRLGLGFAAALLGGATLAEERLEALDRSALTGLLGTSVVLRAVVLEPPRERSFGASVAPARIVSGRGAGERVLLRLAGSSPARWRQGAQGAQGAEVVARGALRPLGRGGAHERRRGAHALLRVRELHWTGRRRGGALGALDGVRARAEAALARGAPEREAGLARGMVLGQDHALDERLREDLRRAGLAHLVAASGTNVALLAALVVAAGAMAGLGLTGRLALALVAIAAYVPLAGAGPSIQRAGVMGAATLVAALAGRPASRVYALLLAAVATLALNPRASADPGWQLSFAAVFALLALGPALTRTLRRVLPAPVAGVLALTLAATVGTAPLVALHFGRVSLVSVGANLLAAPAVPPVMWLGTLAGTVGQVAPVLAIPLAAAAAVPLAYLAWLGAAAAGLPWAEVGLTPSAPSPPARGVLAVLGVAALGAVAGRVLRGRGWWRRAAGDRAAGPRPRRGRLDPRGPLTACLVAGLLGLSAGLGAALLSRPGGGERPRDVVVSFLDVGQGDATLLQHGEHAVLVDTGPPDGAVVARLREAGVARLDALVLTHGSADHDGGAVAVLRALPVGLLLDGGEASHRTSGLEAAVSEAERRGVRRLATDAGQVVRAGPLELRVLWPDRDVDAPGDADPNLRATVLHARDGALDVLLTADAESEVTGRLSLPRMEAMKVAHHGSADPGLPRLLAAVRPRVAVIPVGENRYGHPHPTTLRALGPVPVVRRTDRDGTVRLRAHGGRLLVEAQR
jgi:competence protein ComEC